jgi:hypothetical protein
MLVGYVPCLGYLRPNELHLFDESSVRESFEKAGLAALKIDRTMGGGLDFFCGIFDWLSRNYFILSAFSPLLLIFTLPFRAKHRNGKLLFFSARKNI